MFRTAVIGAAGFAGIDAARLFLHHPMFELVAVSSDSEAGKPLSRVYPFFGGRTDLVFDDHETVIADHTDDLDLMVLAIPHTAAMKMVPTLLEKQISVIDLSADFRLKEASVFEQWYSVAHTAPELLGSVVYGLPELYRSDLAALAEKRAEGRGVLVANPGCYPTASVLAALPPISAGLADPEEVVVINAISGVSGAGKKPNATTHFCSANENLNAYAAVTHRHTPEIAQTLGDAAGHEVAVLFTPHLAPLNRGMVSTAALRLSESAASRATGESIQRLYDSAYADEPFVQVLPQGTMPQSSSVKHSNFAHVGVAYDPSTRMVVASCAIDNLGKGAAMQAVQCANLIFSLDETIGLANEGGIL